MRDPIQHPEDAIRRVYAYVAYQIGAGPFAEEVTSATIARAIRYRSSYRRDAGSATGWLIEIARRCLADEADANPRGRSTRTAVSAGGGDHPEQAAEQTDLVRAVSELDPRSRELVALRYGADLSTKEIGKIYRMSAGAVEIALRRALQELGATLAGDRRRKDTTHVGAG